MSGEDSCTRDCAGKWLSPLIDYENTISNDGRRRLNAQIFYTEHRRRAWKYGEMQLPYEDGLKISFDPAQAIGRFIIRPIQTMEIKKINLTFYRGTSANPDQTEVGQATAELKAPTGFTWDRRFEFHHNVFQVLTVSPVQTGITAVLLQTVETETYATHAALDAAYQNGQISVNGLDDFWLCDNTWDVAHPNTWDDVVTSSLTATGGSVTASQSTCSPGQFDNLEGTAGNPVCESCSGLSGDCDDCVCPDFTPQIEANCKAACSVPR
jgi:hypothetical protein